MSIISEWRDYANRAERLALARIDKLEADAAEAQKLKRQIYDRCRKRMAVSVAKEMK